MLSQASSIGRASVWCAMPGIGVAGGDFFYASCAVVEGQEEGVDIGAAGARLAVVVGVCAWERIGGAMPGV